MDCWGLGGGGVNYIIYGIPHGGNGDGVTSNSIHKTISVEWPRELSHVIHYKR